MPSRAELTEAERARLLDRIDAYLDAVPRTAARDEAVGPFTLFVKTGAWDYYARPTRGAGEVRTADVEALRARQRALGDVPETIEWISDLAPSVAAAASSAGMKVDEHPLLWLPPGGFEPKPAQGGFETRLVSTDDDLAGLQAVAMVSFASPGTAVGPAGPQVAEAVARGVGPTLLAFVRQRVSSGLTVTAAAFDGIVPVAAGSHQPLGDVSEVVGVATLPAFRRRGLGAAITSLLVQDALDRGVETVFLTAGDETIARVYERLGFRRIGTAGAAAPPAPPAP